MHSSTFVLTNKKTISISKRTSHPMSAAVRVTRVAIALVVKQEKEDQREEMAATQGIQVHFSSLTPIRNAPSCHAGKCNPRPCMI